jgi:hypothetical protein
LTGARKERRFPAIEREDRMRRFLLSLSFAAMAVALARIDLTACGDKYIRLAQRLGPGYRAQQAATVLIYMPQSSVVPAAAGKIGLHDALRRAGHKIYSVTREDDLDSALMVRAYDIVIADAASGNAIAPVLQRAAGRPTLVPVFHNESRRELEDARKQLRCLIASRERAYHALAEIEHVMELRRRATLGP